ncbi:MAG: PDZ domain-containing protein [Candidatus Latescibacteria bacterium]|nr:PDZ domain-containing protein [Candidatus Latescibacterota bacterium]
MTKSHKLLVALLILTLSAIILPVAAGDMCDECKKNPEKCNLATGGICDNPEGCSDISNPQPDKKTIAKKVVVLSPDDNRGFLGVYAQTEDAGVVIEQVISESPAEKAGITKGMIITAVKGNKIKTREELIDLLKNTSPGDTVLVTVKSDGKEKSTKVVLDKAPKAESREIEIQAKWDDCIHQDMKTIMGKHEECQKHSMKMNMKMTPSDCKMHCPMMKMPEAPHLEVRGFIGIATEEDKGKLVITRVIPESPAEKEGLKPGDIILQINDIAVAKPGQLVEVLKTTKPGDIAHLKINSAGLEKMMHIKLAPSPAQAKMPMREMKYRTPRRYTKPGRGAVYFGPGVTMFKYGELNALFANQGFDAINSRQFTFGGGGWGQTGRVRLGGHGMGGGQTLVNDSVSVEVGYGVGFFEIGYSLINAKHFIFTPMLGIGGGGLGMKIIARYPPASIDSLLSYPGGQSQVSMGGLAMYPGLAIDIPISFVGLSLKGGYIWSPISSGWIHEGFGAIRGPDINLSGPFASFGIMFGGGK